MARGSQHEEPLNVSEQARQTLAAAVPKGMQNMGATCFMSVVLQTMLHCPLVKGYFLSGAHVSKYCRRSSCMSCALDRMYLDLYNGRPAAAHRASEVLELVWLSAKNLAGYAQQDAHEFFTCLLDQMHQSMPECHSDPGLDSGGGRCRCLVHRVFFGRMRSAHTCDACGYFGRVFEPMMDLSLPVKDNESASPRALNMLEALDIHFRPEQISRYSCPGCGDKTKATKTLAIVSAPPSLCIQLKRFEHVGVASYKINLRTAFPLELDLSPYMADRRTSVSSAASDSSASSSSTAPGASAPARLHGPLVYDLYSVVVHLGKIDSGHYINYLRVGTEWFRLDDTTVTWVTEREVLACEAYLLFYHRRRLS